MKIPIVTIPFLMIISVVLSLSCNKSSSEQQENITHLNETNTVNVEPKEEIILHTDSTKILGKTYYAYYLSTDIFFILNQKEDTVFVDRELFPRFEFDDFNKDGYNDVRVHYVSNTPSVQDLVLFDVASESFKKVERFNNFPDPIKIGKTKYYYSYHRSGCADMNWDSDLFYIENFKAIRIGNISGIQCDDGDENGIYIHKVNGYQKKLYKTLPIVETLGSYPDHKWGFIKAYWTKNYPTFIQ